MEDHSEYAQLKKQYWRYLNYARDIGWPLEQTALGGFVAIIATQKYPIPENYAFGGRNIYVEQFRKSVKQFEREYLSSLESYRNNYHIPYEHPALNSLLVEISYLRLRQDEDLLPLLEDVFPLHRSRGVEHFTPKSVATFLVKVLNVKPNTNIFDPCVGTGGFLAAIQEQMRGHDFDFIATDKITINTILVKLKVLLTGQRNHSILQGSAFALSENLARFDFIISNPPIGRLPKEEARNRYGKVLNGLSSQDMSVNYIELGLKHLKPGGRAVFLVPLGILYSGGDTEKIRQRWVEDRLLVGVITLASNLLLHTGLKCAALIFENTTTSDHIRLVSGEDCAELGEQRRAVLSAENISELIRRFDESGTEKLVSIPSRRELSENAYCLLPSAYLPEEHRLNKTLSENWKKIAEIATVNRGSSLANCPKGDTPVIRGRDIRVNQIDLDDIPEKDLSNYHRQIKISRKDDILIQRIGGNPAAYHVSEREAGIACEDTVFIVRFKDLTTAQIDFICQFLNSEQVSSRLSNARGYSVIPTQTLHSIRELEVPIAEQKIINIVREMNELEKQLKKEHEKSLEFKNALFNGLATDLTESFNDARFTANALDAALKNKDDISYRLRTQYPFPIAYAYRNIYTEREYAGIYERQMKFGEQLLSFLSAIGSILVTKYIQNSETDNVNGFIDELEQSFQGGVSPGHLKSVLQKACKILGNHSDNEHAQEFSLIWYKAGNKKETQFAKAVVTEVVSKLNAHKHHRGPANKYERKIGCDKQSTVLTNLLEHVEFLTKWDLIRVEEINKSWRTNATEYSASLLMGDHPAFEQFELESEEELIKDKLYIQLGNERVCLYPLISLLYNPGTKREEIFTIDKIGGDKTMTLKSFESGSTIDSQEVKADFDHWIRQFKN